MNKRAATKTATNIAQTRAPKNYSGWIYIDGVILSLEKAKSTKDKKYLVEIMEMHEWDNVLITRNGNVVPFNQTDIVISTINRR